MIKLRASQDQDEAHQGDQKEAHQGDQEEAHQGDREGDQEEARQGDREGDQEEAHQGDREGDQEEAHQGDHEEDQEEARQGDHEEATGGLSPDVASINKELERLNRRRAHTAAAIDDMKMFSMHARKSSRRLKNRLLHSMKN